MAKGAMVKVEGLRKNYGTVEAVRGVSLEVQRGEVVVIIGPSGCGKSTFLRCINLLEEPSAGSLQVLDRRIEFGPKNSIPRGRDLARFLKAQEARLHEPSHTLQPEEGGVPLIHVVHHRCRITESLQHANSAHSEN